MIACPLRIYLFSLHQIKLHVFFLDLPLSRESIVPVLCSGPSPAIREPRPPPKILKMKSGSTLIRRIAGRYKFTWFKGVLFFNNHSHTQWSKANRFCKALQPGTVSLKLVTWYSKVDMLRFPVALDVQKIQIIKTSRLISLIILGPWHLRFSGLHTRPCNKRW